LGLTKALLKFGGRTLLEITVERLSEVTGDVVVACGAGTRPGWPEVDARNGDRPCGRAGPLARWMRRCGR
jgi:molybdopterin-guanine dinucleotide biosynthesis protein A